MKNLPVMAEGARPLLRDVATVSTAVRPGEYDHRDSFSPATTRRDGPTTPEHVAGGAVLPGDSGESPRRIVGKLADASERSGRAQRTSDSARACSARSPDVPRS